MFKSTIKSKRPFLKKIVSFFNFLLKLGWKTEFVRKKAFPRRKCLTLLPDRLYLYLTRLPSLVLRGVRRSGLGPCEQQQRIYIQLDDKKAVSATSNDGQYAFLGGPNP